MASPDKTRLCVILEGSSAAAVHWDDIRLHCIEPLLRTFDKGALGEFELALVVFQSRGSHSSSVVDRAGWTSNLAEFRQWLDGVSLTGGGIGGTALAEGLTEALYLFSRASVLGDLKAVAKQCMLVMVNADAHRLTVRWPFRDQCRPGAQRMEAGFTELLCALKHHDVGLTLLTSRLCTAQIYAYFYMALHGPVTKERGKHMHQVVQASQVGHMRHVALVSPRWPAALAVLQQELKAFVQTWRMQQAQKQQEHERTGNPGSTGGPGSTGPSYLTPGYTPSPGGGGVGTPTAYTPPLQTGADFQNLMPPIPAPAPRPAPHAPHIPSAPAVGGYPQNPTAPPALPGHAGAALRGAGPAGVSGAPLPHGPTSGLESVSVQDVMANVGADPARQMPRIPVARASPSALPPGYPTRDLGALQSPPLDHFPAVAGGGPSSYNLASPGGPASPSGGMSTSSAHTVWVGALTISPKLAKLETPTPPKLLTAEIRVPVTTPAHMFASWPRELQILKLAQRSDVLKQYAAYLKKAPKCQFVITQMDQLGRSVLMSIVQQKMVAIGHMPGQIILIIVNVKPPSPDVTMVGFILPPSAIHRAPTPSPS